MSSFTRFSQATTIPNPNFEQALIDLEIDTNEKNNNILNSDAVATNSLNVLNKEIANLYGLASTSLTRLDYQRNDLYSIHLALRIFSFFFFLFSALKFTSIVNTMLENLCLDKRKNKSAKFSENLNVLSIETALVVPKNMALDYLSYSGSQLTELNKPP